MILGDSMATHSDSGFREYWYFRRFSGGVKGSGMILVFDVRP